jgi:hypothetical protein
MAFPTLGRLPIAFPVLLVGVLCVVVLVAPLPYGPRWADGHAIGDRPTTCLHLDDGQSARETLVPPTAMLLPLPAPGFKDWYVARFARARQVPDAGWWRTIDEDSIEIRWHHSPSIRLAVRGTTVSGTEQPAGVAPLLEILFERSRSVSGTVIPCSGISTGPPDVR